MTLPVVLIDFENVQPKVLDRLRPGATRVKVFLGQHQTKLMLELVQALQPFGRDAEYIQIQGSGPDAVDFHIAFYIGQLAAIEPSTQFTIVSKDRGFDPLIRHLASLKIDCRRVAELPELTAARTSPVVTSSTVSKPKAATSKAPSVSRDPSPTTAPVAKKSGGTAQTRARAKAVVEHLKKSTKPARLSTLRSTIKAWFNPTLDDKAIDAVLQSLQASKHLSVVGTKVTYTLG